MEFSISRGKHGIILCEDDNGIITFEAPRPGTVELGRDNITDIEGGIDIANMDQWLDSAVAEVRAWATPKR